MLARVQNQAGKRVLMPRSDERFLGPRDRARARLRERRRRVLVVLLEGVGITALVGAFPPLRAMWIVTALLVGMLGLYVWTLMQLRANAGASMPLPATVTIPDVPEPAPAPRASTPMFDQDDPAPVRDERIPVGVA